ncbi:MAG: hypothetical protein IJF56_08175 [Clostridia bacterium]|nr:hypothetical protein [Clostridia bacterium]
MKHRIVPALFAFLLLVMSGCGKKEETTLTGMVVSVDGTVVSLQTFDSEMREMPTDGEMPNMGDPNGFQNFDSGKSDGEAFDPEDFNPEDFEGSMPELPEGAEMPERPENGERPDFGSAFSGGETTTVDLADAHISIQIDDGKAAGSIDDITEGAFLTITMNGKGKATNVVVGSTFGFGRAPSAEKYDR